jgi:hypothetical protein
LPIKKHKKKLANQVIGRGKKVQLEELNMDEAKNTKLRIIYGQLFAQVGTKEGQTVQLAFVLVIPYHYPCEVEMLNHAVAKFRNI